MTVEEITKKIEIKSNSLWYQYLKKEINNEEYNTRLYSLNWFRKELFLGKVNLEKVYV